MPGAFVHGTERSGAGQRARRSHVAPFFGQETPFRRIHPGCNCTNCGTLGKLVIFRLASPSRRQPWTRRLCSAS